MTDHILPQDETKPVKQVSMDDLTLRPFYDHHLKVGNYPVTEAVERWVMTARANQEKEGLL